MAMTEWTLGRTAVGLGNLKIILCDDDPAFLETLNGQLHSVFRRLNKKAEISLFSTPSALSAEQMVDCDMAFLDIDFDGGEQNGIDIASQLRQVNEQAMVFFVTNFIEYAPAGYEVRAFRYILKRDVDQVLERYVLQAMEELAQGQEYLRLQSRDEEETIPLENIRYFEVMDHSVSIYADDRIHTLNTPLSGLEEQLDGHGFLRVHKSFLVNMHFIRKFRSRECILNDGTTLPVSEKNYGKQKQKYLLWKGMK